MTVLVKGYDNSGFEVTLTSGVQIKNDDELATEVAKLIKSSYKLGLRPKLDPEITRGLDWQWVTHFIIRKHDKSYAVDLFNKYLNMKLVTLYVGDDGVLDKLKNKSGITDIEKYKVYPAASFDKSEQGEDSEFFHEFPKGFGVTIKPAGVYKDGKAKGKQKMKAIL